MLLGPQIIISRPLVIAVIEISAGLHSDSGANAKWLIFQTNDRHTAAMRTGAVLLFKSGSRQQLHTYSFASVARRRPRRQRSAEFPIRITHVSACVRARACSQRHCEPFCCCCRSNASSRVPGSDASAADANAARRARVDWCRCASNIISACRQSPATRNQRRESVQFMR